MHSDRATELEEADVREGIFSIGDFTGRNARTFP